MPDLPAISLAGRSLEQNLPIVQAFTEARCGRTSMESKPGEGATFRFTLPAKAQANCQEAR